MKTKYSIVLLIILTMACKSKMLVNQDDYKMDLRYSPMWGQTAINLPDETQKTVVDNEGKVYYDFYNVNRDNKWIQGPFNGFNLVVSSGIDSIETEGATQHLYSAKVPLLITSSEKKGIRFETEIFAVAPALKLSHADSCELSKGFIGLPHNDIMIVHLKNNGNKDKSVVPKLFIKSVYPIDRNIRSNTISVDKRITISLPEGISSFGEKPYNHGHQYIIEFKPITLKAGTDSTMVIALNIGNKAVQVPSSVKEALDYKSKSIAFWENYKFPYECISVPDSNIQNLVYSCIRNIYQAREIKRGLPAFQVGPTVYRGLWIVDGSFLLEAMTYLGQEKDVRNGIEYMLEFQRKNGSFELIEKHWKETGIVLWAVTRHAKLTGDKQWLESKWENVEKAVAYIDTMRSQTMKDPSAPNYGLIPKGFSDGGLSKNVCEYTNIYWTLNGLKAAAEAAAWLDKRKEAQLWKAKYDTMSATMKKDATRDLRTDSCGNHAIPIFMVDSCQIQRAQWAFCHAVFPGKLFNNDDPLLTGTMNMLQCHEKEGLVYETGWLDKGIWNYFGSFYAHAWLWMGDGQKAAKTMYAMANHASPTLVWREEQRLKKDHNAAVVGDMPHNWASAEFIRMIRHFILLERGSEMHLFEALPPTWTKPGMETKLKGVYTEFGIVDVNLIVTKDGKTADIRVSLNSTGHQKPSAVVIHLDALNGEKPLFLKPEFPIHITRNL
jgi:hypothetical protein